jgi:TolA-binding protein
VQLKTLFDKKKYKQVVEDGPKVIKAAKGKEKEEATFMVAESFYRMGKLRDAALQFNQYLETKPTGKHVPLANMRMGDSFRQLGDTATAKIYYEELITNYPSSEEAAKAKERLAEIGGAPGGEKQGSALKPTGPQKKVARASN